MILVTGATGNVGAQVVAAALAAGAPVRALVREGSSGLPAGAGRAVGDLNQPDSLTGALAGADALFLMSGYRDAPRLLALARQAGVKRVALLSGGAAVAARVDNPISQYMLGTEQAVRESGLIWTILRPYEFMSNALRWTGQLSQGDVVRAPFAGIPVAVIDPRDIAAVAVAALLGEGHGGQTYRLSGPGQLLPAQRLDILAAALGRSLRLIPQTDAEARQEMLASMPAEYVDAFFQFYSGGTLDESTVLPTVAEITGRPAGTFQEWAAAYAGRFG